MHLINKSIDMSVWTGNWPFIHLRYGELSCLKEKLQSINVKKAYIAPIEGILEQDPMRANIELLSKVKDDLFSPVFIVDLSFANWQECMDVAINDGRVRMIKLLPNYHMYGLDVCKLDKLVEITQKNKMLVSIQMRVEDKRMQYPLLKVDDVNAHDIIKALAGFPEQVFILNNILLHEIRYIMDSLDNVYFDIPFIEHQDTLEQINNMFSLDRFLFSSHCPFFFPEGNLSKLKKSRLDINEVEKVMYRNAEKLFI